MRFRKLLAAFMVASMVLGLIGSAAFAQGSDQALFDEAVEMLGEFKIVQGDERGLRPNDSITRAEMIKVLVTAAGQGEVAALLAGAPAFSDSQNHWASGYIALAKNMGLTTGYPDGTFRPDAEVTYAEVVAMLTRLVGVQPAAGTWPTNYIQAANDAGINAANMDLTGLANAAAVRGAVFVLSHSAFMNVKDSGGKNLYQKSFDSTPPTITVDAVSSPTEAASVTVSGKATDATAAFVNGSAVELAADGSFSADIELALGANEIVVTAVDQVGNEGSAAVAIERINAPAAAIEAAESLEVVAGGSADIAATVKDKNGVAIEGAEVTGAVSPEDLGTYAAGTFTAGTATGTGTLTLSSGDVSTEVSVTVTAGELASITLTPSATSVAPGELVTISATGLDQYGNNVSVSPTFSVDGGNALINPSSGNFIASKAGSYTVTATVGDVTGTTTIGVYGDVADVELTGAETVVANGETEASFTVTLVDENGNAVVTDDGELGIYFDDGAVKVFDDDGDELTAVNGGARIAVNDGKATFTVAGLGGAAGQVVTITAKYDADEDNEFADDDIDDSADIELLDQVASAVKVDTNNSAKYLLANDGGNTANVMFKVVDQEGEDMVAGNWDVTFTVDGPATLDTDHDDYDTIASPGDWATAVVESKKGQTGTVTVTATVEGVGSVSGTVTAAVSASAAKLDLEVNKTEAIATDDDAGEVAKDNRAEVKITVTDDNGVPVAGTYDLLVDLGTDAASDLYVGNVAATFDPDDDVWEVSTGGAASLTLHLYGQKAGSFDISVEDADDDFAAVKGQVSVVAADAANVEFDVDWDDNQALLIGPNVTGTLKLQVVDEFGNAVKKSGVEVTVSAIVYENPVGMTVTQFDGKTTTDKLVLNGKEKEVKVTTDENGQATVTVETRPYEDNYLVGISGTDISGFDTSAQVQFSRVNTLTVLPADISLKVLNDQGNTFSSIGAKERITLEVEVEDAYGTAIENMYNWLTIDVGDDILSTAYDNSAEDEDEVNDHARANWTYSGGSYSVDLYTAKSGRQTITVSLAGLVDSLKASRTFTVKALDANKVTLDGGADAVHEFYDERTGTAVGNVEGMVTVEEGETAAFTVKLVDALGNAVALSAAESVSIALYRLYDDQVNGNDNGKLDIDPSGTEISTTTDISIRSSESGSNISSLDLKSTKKLYVVANDKASEDQLTTYAIALTLDGTTSWIEVEMKD